MNHYKKESHKEVSEAIKKIQNIKWIVSYDNVPELKIYTPIVRVRNTHLSIRPII